MIDSACYDPVNDKIFAAMGPRVLQFNSITGQREAVSEPVCSPASGPCYIEYHSLHQKLYISVWNTHASQSEENTSHRERDIYQVDPATLTLDNSLNLWELRYFYFDSYAGPMFMKAIGSHLWLCDFRLIDSPSFNRIDPMNPAFTTTSQSIGIGIHFRIEQFGYNGTYTCLGNPLAPRFERLHQTASMMNQIQSINITESYSSGILSPFVGEFCGDDAYFLSNNRWLWRAGSWVTPKTYTRFDLYSILSGSKSWRMKYSPLNSLLYIPCHEQNAFIIWSPQELTGSVMSGFEGPIDVVFTNSKSFAVQTGPISLKEIA